MTKKNDPFDGAEIDQDSEPLHFEEASSLFDEGSEESKKDSKVFEATSEEKVEAPTPEVKAETSPEESFTAEEEEMDDLDGVHTIGAFLKQMREEKGINIKIISQHTKISVTNLELLEADDLERLPNRAYVIGYVKSYAKTLQLKQADCLELLDATYGIEKVAVEEVSKPQVTARTKSESNNKENSEDANGIKIGIALGAIAIIVFLLVLDNTGDEDDTEKNIKTVEKVSKPEKKVVPQTLGATTPLKETSAIEEELAVKVTSTESDKPEAIATPVPKEQLEEIKKVEAKPTPEPVVEEKKVEEKKEEVTKKEETKKEEKIKFRALAKTLYSDDTSMSQEEIDRLLPNKYRAAVVEGSHNVFINAYKEDSWLTYKADDGPIKKFVLRKGRTILIRGKLVRVFLGNLGAVKVFRNNKPQRITSSSGVKSLVFPQERGSEFVIPLFIFNKNGGVQTSEEYLENNPE